jgi:lantibiotic modifying enzyme
MVELATGLATSLALIAGPTLLDRFLSYPGRRWLDPTARAAYDRFADDLCVGGLETLLEATPALSALLIAARDDWVRETARFVTRLAMDAPLLGETYAFTLPAVGARQAVRTAIELTDRAGARVMYKSRRLAMDVAFGEVLAWFNAKGPPLALRWPATTDRGEHGWTQHIDHRWPGVPTERADYLRRCGMLLCLVHLLGGGDMHDANLRIQDACPVLVDAEKVLRPGLPALTGDGAQVTATYLLPTVPGFERCGLAAELYLERPRPWLHLESDAVRRRPAGHWLASVRPTVHAHLASNAGDMVRWLGDGFRSAYDLIGRALPLDAFSGSRARVLLRSTARYDDLLERCLWPEVLHVPGARDARLQAFVGQAPPVAAARPALRSAVALAERHALGRQRAPRFWCPVAGTTLVSELGVAGAAFASAPIDRAHRFLASMSPAHRDQQIAAIGLAFARLVQDGDATGATPGISPLPLAEVLG